MTMIKRIALNSGLNEFQFYEGYIHENMSHNIIMNCAPLLDIYDRFTQADNHNTCSLFVLGSISLGQDFVWPVRLGSEEPPTNSASSVASLAIFFTSFSSVLLLLVLLLLLLPSLFCERFDIAETLSDTVQPVSQLMTFVTTVRFCRAKKFAVHHKHVVD